MAERLVVLSDMMGAKHGMFITSYLGYLQSYFDITYYDSQHLANIDIPVKTLENVREAFRDGGIDTGVVHLLNKEHEASHYLTFCAGGDIAYRAALMGLPVKSLTAISPMYMEEVTGVPDCPVKLLYGGKDEVRVSESWKTAMGVEVEEIPDFGHQLYSDEKIIQHVCKSMLDNLLKEKYQKL